MSSTRDEQQVLLEVTQLSLGGMSRRAIARTLGISRNTVRKLLAGHQRQRSTAHLALKAPPKRMPRPSKLEPYRGAVEQLLTRFPDITAQRVFEELKHQGFEGGYTAVKQYVRKSRPRPPPVLSLPAEQYGPGKMAESDWSPFTVDFTHAGRRTVQAFAYTLTYSRRKFFGFFERADLHALMEGHVHAFTVFGGAAEQCKYDNQKPVVLRWEGRQPIYNPRFIDFATHYDFRPVACRPRHPNDKPRVERSFWELERSFLNGRQFRDEEDLTAQLRLWQAQVCDVRRHKKTRRSAMELFPEDFAALRPLPAHPYDTARVIYRVCDVEGFISWDGNRYSVPFHYVTDLLPARVTTRELFVYAADLSCIARHELRRPGLGEDVIAQAHRPSSFRHGADLEQLRPVYEQLGEEARRYLESLEAALPRSAAYQARMILGLRSRYLSEDLDKALAHARRFGAFEHQAVERILAAKATPRRLEEYVAEATAQKLDEVIGSSVTEPRDLAEYDTLPCWSGHRPGQGFTAQPPGAPPCRRSEPNERRPDTPPPSEPRGMPNGSNCDST